MTPYTLTLTEARDRLGDLLQQASQTRHPILITTDEGQSLAFVEPISEPLTLQAQEQTRQITRRLDMLEALLASWTSVLDAPEAQKTFTVLFHDQLRSLSRSLTQAEPTLRQFVLLLRLAIKYLEAYPLQSSQVPVLRAGLDILRQGSVSTEDLRRYDRQLLDCGIQARLTFGEDVLAAYVEDS